MFQKVYDYLTANTVAGTDVTYGQVGLVFAVLLLALVIGRIVWFILERTGNRLKQNEKSTLLGLFLVVCSRPALLFCFAIGFQAALSSLGLNDETRRMADGAGRAAYTVALAYLIFRLVAIVEHYLTVWTSKTETKMDDMLVPLVRKALRITVVILALLFVVENFYDGRVATLLAGLGIGGLAVALAAQDTIKNFFGSLMILLDKPFVIGDRVVMDGHDGPVEQVGFRSTKIRTLDGHLVTVPNDRVANTSVQNIGARPYIRRLANITITYDTPPAKVERALQILHELLDNHEGMNPEFPPRVYFNEFNDASLNLIMIYWYHPPDYWKYLEFTDKLNREILRRFNDEGIDFAFPTQTIHVANDEKRQLALRLLEDSAPGPGA